MGESKPQKGGETSAQTNQNTQRAACLTKKRFFVSDSENHCIKAFDKSGTFLHKFGKRGNQDGQFKNPNGLLIDSSNNLLVYDWLNNRVQQFLWTVASLSKVSLSYLILVE